MNLNANWFLRQLDRVPYLPHLDPERVDIAPIHVKDIPGQTWDDVFRRVSRAESERDDQIRLERNRRVRMNIARILGYVGNYDSKFVYLGNIHWDDGLGDLPLSYLEVLEMRRERMRMFGYLGDKGRLAIDLLDNWSWNEEYE